ncbi:MAG TPA: TldD/PmbA family protein [Longimicrobiales bacterium]|nr:TldD/PmbA family protein [Longimicrobiales bacterium]
MDRRTLLAPLAPGRALRESSRAGAPPGGGLTEAEARALSSRILGMIVADEARVNLSSGREGNTRYAVNRITTAGDAGGVSASILVRYGRRSATVSTNRFDDESLRAAVDTAQTLARLAPEDPEAMPELEPIDYPAGAGHVAATAALDAVGRAQVAGDAIERALAAGLEVAGYLEASDQASAIANSRGLFGYNRSTAVDYSVTARTEDGLGSGWAGTGHRDWSAIDAAALHARAIAKALASREARPLAAGVYPAILEPAAVLDLVRLLPSALDARRAHEGRSAFSRPDQGTAIDERLLDPKITLRSDPLGMGASPFAADGLPALPRTWIRNGRLQRLAYSRWWAQQRGVEPTGFPGSIRMEGEPRSLEQLIAETERAVLVTRFWYVRSLDPRTLLYTGLTRDGTFWVEDGRIQYPVNNFRWNDSPLLAFRNVDALTRPERVASGYELPAMRVPEFDFASVSEAV